MDIKLELLSEVISETIYSAIKNMDINTDKMIDSKACKILDEIKNVIQDVNIENDFEIVEEIVCIFEKHGINAGSRHDFG